ncbi:MAG: hypothetical protein LC791_14295 [Acidobacteria bacterium]|nr:hypothetical protein [Acidobacteriota bacterium]
MNETRGNLTDGIQVSSMASGCEPRRLALVTLVVIITVAPLACSRNETPAAPPAASRSTPTDPQHAGITSPHGDHSPHRGGMVLMKGDMHFEVVFDRTGRHQVWFTDAVRSDLPATVATGVTMVVARKGEPPEALALSIDENGESWRASGRPVTGDDVMVTVTYNVEGEL